eukprot:CAMPEP_0171893422 /NCGR_PEP_ID=MMETSP0992-20121227/45870_1 /TAXON_ID=483369 /ORGANISM="non described non described, Strain CCMP2098" /LENGTH=241 /DNA_ID=CAMNT_0012521035 /DNA_START=47 /DNA_END=769 /DNA_ORIENTATION=-
MPNEIPPSAFYCASPVWRVRIHPEPVSIREGCEKFPRHRRREWVVDQAVRLCCCGSLSLAVSTTAISAAVVAAQYFSACAAAFPLSPLRNLVGVDLSHAAEDSLRTTAAEGVPPSAHVSAPTLVSASGQSSGIVASMATTSFPAAHRNTATSALASASASAFSSALPFSSSFPATGADCFLIVQGTAAGLAAVLFVVVVVARCAVTRFGTGLTPNRVTAVAVVTAKAAQTAAPPSVLAAPP